MGCGWGKVGAVCLGLSAVWGALTLVKGQEMGAEPEMYRLEQRADELIAQGDPEGASLSIGKAAMMAAELSKQEQEGGKQHLFRAIQKMFRAQEQVFRALALFERAGGVAPASSGVCVELSQALQKFKETGPLFQSQELNVADRSIAESVQQRQSTTKEWHEMVLTLQEDVGCGP